MTKPAKQPYLLQQQPINEWMRGCSNEWMWEWTKYEWLNLWIDKQMNELMNKWMNKSFNRMSNRINK